MTRDAHTAFSRAVVDEWVRGGVTHACVAPGSRSTPMAHALAADGRVSVHVFLDERSAAFAALGIGRASARPAVVLCHNPDACDLPGWRDFQGWVLSGHTHGGQCRPPFLPPPLLPVKNPRYTAGTIALGEHRTLYINRGLGHLLKVRFNARPEVTIFTLEKARA